MCVHFLLGIDCGLDVKLNDCFESLGIRTRTLSQASNSVRAERVKVVKLVDGWRLRK